MTQGGERLTRATGDIPPLALHPQAQMTRRRNYTMFFSGNTHRHTPMDFTGRGGAYFHLHNDSRSLMLQGGFEVTWGLGFLWGFGIA